MSAFRSVSLRSAALLALALAGCHDARREAVREWLQANPPPGFEVATIPDDLVIAETTNGDGTARVAMSYRLLEPTVEVHDLFSLPQAAGISKSLAAIRGWALASLPAGDPTREAIVSQTAKARTAFPVKRVVSPKGAGVDAIELLTVHQTADGWQITSDTPAVSAPGSADRNPNIPFEDSALVTTKLAELAATVQSLESARAKFLDDRRKSGDRSLALLGPKLEPGNVFEGVLPDRTPVRLIVSRGTNAKNQLVAVLSIEGAIPSSARYIGTIALEPSGVAVWRAARVTSLASPGTDPATDETLHPILSVKTEGNGLAAEVKMPSRAPISFHLTPAGTEDLIPESSLQDTSNNR